MHPVIKSDISADIGGDQQRIHNAETEYSNIQFKHLLLPFWVAGFRFGKKSYQFIVNARTGEVQGERPFSKWKIFLAALGFIILVVLMLGIFWTHSNQQCTLHSSDFRRFNLYPA